MRWNVTFVLTFAMLVGVSSVYAGDSCCTMSDKSAASTKQKAACNYSKKEKKTAASSYKPPVWR